MGHSLFIPPIQPYRLNWKGKRICLEQRPLGMNMGVLSYLTGYGRGRKEWFIEIGCC